MHEYTWASAVACHAKHSLGISPNLLVVVKNNYHVLVQESSMVHGFVSHASSDCAISYHCYHMVLLALKVTGSSHAQCSRDGGGAVPSPKWVVLGLIALSEAFNA